MHMDIPHVYVQQLDHTRIDLDSSCQ